MKKFYTTGVFIAVIAVISFLLYGCGTALLTTTGSTAAAAGTLSVVAGITGAGARGVEIADKGIKAGPGDMNDTSYNHANPWYRDRLQAPSTYTAGLAEMKFLTQNNYDDASAYTVSFNNIGGLPVSTTNPYPVEMSTGTVTINCANTLPAAGTYTHMGINLIYIEQTLSGCFSTTTNLSRSNERFRVCPSTVSPVQAGDILFYSGGVWNWINPTTFALTPITSSRPGGTASGWDSPSAGGLGLVPTGAPVIATGVQVLQDQFWSLRPANTLMVWQVASVASMAANNYLFKEANAIATPITIAAAHSYTFAATFNVAVTPDPYFTGGNAISGETGTFFWDDATNDGVFMPFLAYNLGGDQNDGTHSVPSFFPCPPTVTPTATQTN